ncbi:MAG: hypothetical protein AB7Q81_25310 [Gammaproteobacteria bacterium]
MEVMFGERDEVEAEFLDLPDHARAIGECALREHRILAGIPAFEFGDRRADARQQHRAQPEAHDSTTTARAVAPVLRDEEDAHLSFS